MRIATSLIVMGLVGCAAPRSTPTTAPPAPTETTPSVSSPAPSAPLVAPGLRLPATFAVERYAPTLTIDPDQSSFTGEIVITARLTEASDAIWLHAKAMTIEHAVATVAGGEVPLAIAPDAEHERVALRSPKPLPPGPLTVTVHYRGAFEEVDSAGAFRQAVDGRWYVFTQHEALYARRTFPCVDEPGVKVPWQLTLIVPEGLTAAANALIARESVDGGRRRVEFAPTPPLPSYLTAFAVGPFDVVDGGRTSAGAPIRVLAPAGRGGDAWFAAEATGKLLAELERWFGMPYPYAKLDSVAIPTTVGFGAMENPGLITYRADLLLMPKDASAQRRRDYAAVGTHELAHQWFGDLVTPAWWDDLWLNESFATWLPTTIVPRVYPALAPANEAANARGRSIGADSLASARAIRQPIVTEDDVNSAFDGITYGKGAAVLRMFEHDLGPEVMQRGVRAYLAAHAHGNATAADFLAALDAAAPGRGVGAAMRTFLDQAGAPRLTAKVVCEPTGVAVELSQTRALPLGAPPPSTMPVWRMPACLLIERGGAVERTCVTVDQPTQRVPLTGTTCPAWVWPNAGGLGYFRAGVDGAAWTAILASKRLDAATRIAVVDDLVAAVDAGAIELDVALAAVPTLAGGRRAEVAAASALLGRTERGIPAADRPRVQRALRRWFARGRKLGVLTGARDDLETAAERRMYLELLGATAEDPAILAAAVAAAPRWRSLSSDDRPWVLGLAARAKPAFHDQLMAAFVAETDPEIRDDLAGALGATRDKARLEKALALMLDPAIDIRAAAGIAGTAVGDDQTRPVVEAFVRANADAILARMPPQWRPRILWWLTGGCDAAAADELRAFAADKLAGAPGAPRAIAQAIERMVQCSARRERFAPATARWLRTLPR